MKGLRLVGPDSLSVVPPHAKVNKQQVELRGSCNPLNNNASTDGMHADAWHFSATFPMNAERVPVLIKLYQVQGCLDKDLGYPLALSLPRQIFRQYFHGTFAEGSGTNCSWATMLLTSLGSVTEPS